MINRKDKDKLPELTGSTPDQIGTMPGIVSEVDLMGKPEDMAAPQTRQEPKKIGANEIHKARQTLLEYQQGKSNLEQNIIENERWYQQRHWELLRRENTGGVEPTSGWLFNAIQNKHADAMDNYPSPNILPREEGEALAQNCGAEAMWVDAEGNRFYTPGFQTYICQ